MKKIFRANGKVKKEKKEDVAKVKEFLTPELNVVEKTTATFQIRGVEFKNRDIFWDLKIVIDAPLKEYLSAYTVCFDFNESGINSSIKDLEGKINLMESENTLFGKMKEEKIFEMNEAITELEAERIKLKKELGEIKFKATTSKIDCDTSLIVFKVLPEVVVEIINKYSFINQYKINLEPIF